MQKEQVPKSKVYSADSVTVLQQRPLKPRHPIKAAQLWLLFRRVLVLVAAIVYINNALQCAFCAWQLMNGVIDHTSKTHLANNIASFAQPTQVPEGETPTVGKGKLVQQFLGGHLTPRAANDTIYLHSTTEASYTECDAWASDAHQRMYGASFLHKLFSEVVRDTPYAVPPLVGTQMIVPVVDCSFTALQKGDKTHLRAFYLMRTINSTNADDTFLLTFSLSMQDYLSPDIRQLGPTALLVISVVSDFTDDHVVHYYALSVGSPFSAASYAVFTRKEVTEKGFMVLESIPTPETAGQPTKVYQVSARTGIFRNTEDQQGNIENAHWEPCSKPFEALSRWEWHGLSIRHDSWAWVHGIHYIFAAETIFNLVVLLVVIYRNYRKGKIWIGDAFVSISKSTLTRAALVIIAWELNGFWTANKFVLSAGNAWGEFPTFVSYPQMMRGDMMMVYLGIVDLIGYIMCERIDPALSVLLFEIGFTDRRDFAYLFPSIVTSVINYAKSDFALGIAFIHPKLVSISPLRISTTHEILDPGTTITFAATFPTFFPLIFLLAYVPLRKIYHHYYPDRIVKESGGSRPSVDTEAMLAWKGSLTVFEVATGAALQSRVGLVSDYDSCVYIKGIKFASADGIYCNGFICVNNKYLIRTTDLWMIMLMLLTRIRFRDVYVYDIEGYTVQKMARLFYPEMMTLGDLFHLHSMILS